MFATELRYLGQCLWSGLPSPGVMLSQERALSMQYLQAGASGMYPTSGMFALLFCSSLHVGNISFIPYHKMVSEC